VDGTNVNNVNVDTVRRRTVSGTIVAQDGLAVALGGLIEEQVSDTRDQIPILGSIPHIGFLFRRQATSRTRTELIVVVRPYVFTTATESAATSQQLLGELRPMLSRIERLATPFHQVPGMEMKRHGELWLKTESSVYGMQET
jgi:general secretion pathway protein D